jgi:hypothetical protein
MAPPLQLARIVEVTRNFGMKELPGPTLLDVSQGLTLYLSVVSTISQQSLISLLTLQRVVQLVEALRN